MSFDNPPLSDHPTWLVSDVFPEPLKLVSTYLGRNYSAGLHTHVFYEINVIFQGNGVHYIGEHKLNVTMGDVFIIPPHVPHAYQGEMDFDVYHLHLSPRYLEKYAADLQMLPAFSALFRLEPLIRQKGNNNLHLHLTKDEFEQLYPVFMQLHEVSKQTTAEGKLLYQSLTTILLTHICVYYEKRQSEKQNIPIDHEMIQSLSYLYEHYQEKILIKDLAKIAQTSRSSYVTRFKRICGVSPGEFLTQHRIDMAESMLRETSLSLTQIASATGFYDASHLVHAFLKHRGFSPTEYRSSLKK
jgi:AraC-like DNA-binding protein